MHKTFVPRIISAAICLMIVMSSGYSQIQKSKYERRGCSEPFFIDTLFAFPPISKGKNGDVNLVYRVLDSLASMKPREFERTLQQFENAGADTLYTLLKYWERVNDHDGLDFFKYYWLAGPGTNSGYRRMPLNIVRKFWELAERRLADQYPRELFIAESDLIAEVEITSVSMVLSSTATKEYYDQYSVTANLKDILKGKGLHDYSKNVQNGAKTPIVNFCYKTLQKGGDIFAGDTLIVFLQSEGSPFADVLTSKMPVTTRLMNRVDRERISGYVEQAGVLKIRNGKVIDFDGFFDRQRAKPIDEFKKYILNIMNKMN